MEDLSDLFPGQSPGPARQKLHVGPRQTLLAFGPWYGSPLPPAPPTAPPPHHVQEEDRNAPQRHELEQPGLQRVVAGAWPAATRTDRPTVPTRPNLHDQYWIAVDIFPLDIPIDERLEFLHPIQNSLQLHPVPASCFGRFRRHRNTGIEQDALAFYLCHLPHFPLCSRRAFPPGLWELWESARSPRISTVSISPINGRPRSAFVPRILSYWLDPPPGPVGTVNKPSTFLARLIQATVGKAAKRFAFSIVAAVSIGLPPFTPVSADPAAFF